MKYINNKWLQIFGVLTACLLGLVGCGTTKIVEPNNYNKQITIDNDGDEEDQEYVELHISELIGVQDGIYGAKYKSKINVESSKGYSLLRKDIMTDYIGQGQQIDSFDYIDIIPDNGNIFYGYKIAPGDTSESDIFWGNIVGEDSGNHKALAYDRHEYKSEYGDGNNYYYYYAVPINYDGQSSEAYVYGPFAPGFPGNLRKYTYRISKGADVTINYTSDTQAIFAKIVENYGSKTEYVYSRDYTKYESEQHFLGWGEYRLKSRSDPRGEEGWGWWDDDESWDSGDPYAIAVTTEMEGGLEHYAQLTRSFVMQDDVTLNISVTC